ncbi:MAG: hypothetical protein LBF22_00870, partial [Deltaproteobacteria bacterium]|nr:hypothetical protein [Deltaproteobacteria bacterium]
MKENRLMKIKCIRVNDLGGMKLHAYLCKNLVETNKTEYNILSKFDMHNTEIKEIDKITKKLRKRGIFILLTSIKQAMDKILPFYYERQDIEQIFGFVKTISIY